MICGRDPLPPVHGAQGCPRKAGHKGPCYWTIAWEEESGLFRVIVYSGPPEERRKRCKGVFSGPPSALDVHALLETLSPIRKREIGRRTPQSEPEPIERAVPVIVPDPVDPGMVRIKWPGLAEMRNRKKGSTRWVGV